MLLLLTFQKAILGSIHSLLKPQNMEDPAQLPFFELLLEKLIDIKDLFYFQLRK